ncbi:hypothetical protein TRVL_03418 [Trypanosoma vivax]|nr:hypothetical protein TRVL_03418 [Trypanosoma vivax]
MPRLERHMLLPVSQSPAAVHSPTCISSRTVVVVLFVVASVHDGNQEVSAASFHPVQPSASRFAYAVSFFLQRRIETKTATDSQLNIKLAQRFFTGQIVTKLSSLLADARPMNQGQAASPASCLGEALEPTGAHADVRAAISFSRHQQPSRGWRQKDLKQHDAYMRRGVGQRSATFSQYVSYVINF